MYINLYKLVMYISFAVCYDIRGGDYMEQDRKNYLYQYQKEKLKRIPLDVSKEKYDQIKAAADAAGESVNGYFQKAVDTVME